MHLYLVSLCSRAASKPGRRNFSGGDLNRPEKTSPAFEPRTGRPGRNSRNLARLRDETARKFGGPGALTGRGFQPRNARLRRPNWDRTDKFPERGPNQEPGLEVARISRRRRRNGSKKQAQLLSLETAPPAPGSRNFLTPAANRAETIKSPNWLAVSSYVTFATS